MTNVLKTKYVAFLVALIIGVNNAYADQCEPTCNDTCLAPCNDSCCKDCWFSGDLLYWTACEDGFGCDFGTTDITTTAAAGRVITDIREEDDDIDFEWSPGFRLGAGTRLCSCWDAALYWTHLNTNGRGHDGANRAHWKLWFNEVDAVVGYKFDCCCNFTVRPFLGVRYARINQRFSAHLESTINVPAVAASSLAISSKHHNERFQGAGPLLGFEADFNLGCGFSVYGNLAGHLLYGEFKNRFNDSDTFTAAINNCNSNSESCAVLRGYDAGLGIRYDYCCTTIQLGLEHHGFIDYNHIGCGGDLNLYGFNASVIVRF